MRPSSRNRIKPPHWFNPYWMASRTGDDLETRLRQSSNQDFRSSISGRVREAAAGHGTLLAVVEPLLAAWQALREQIAVFDRQILSRAKTDAVIRRLMTIPGVGAIVALSYTAVIDDPTRFRCSSSVGVYAGLTPPAVSVRRD